VSKLTDSDLEQIKGQTNKLVGRLKVRYGVEKDNAKQSSTTAQTLKEKAMNYQNEKGAAGKGLLLWLIGVPIPVILILWLLGVFH
jgi:uncharacterized protein YjbJ (UPF0337 family)